MPALLPSDRALALSDLLRAVPHADGLVQSVSLAHGAAEPRIAGIGPLSGAGPTEISFIVHPKYLDQLSTTKAAAIIVLPQIEEQISQSGQSVPYARVISKHPYLLYARVAQWFDWARQPAVEPGIHPSAIVDPTAVISPDATIGPHVVIGAHTHIGPMTQIHAGCAIGSNVHIGDAGVFHPRVTVYDGVIIGHRTIIHSGAVLGADGFGFAPDPSIGKGAWGKIPQLGGLVIGDDVEIGANTTVDRGALDNTVIGDGVKLDNQIMIGHNCRIGAHTAMAACVGVAGSTTIGSRCTIGGAAMLSGHLVLGDDVHISGGTAVTSSISEPGRYTGVFPYASHADWQRNAAVIQQLSSLRKRLRILERDPS